MNQKEQQKKLLQLEQSLPPGLPQPPRWLVNLSRDVKKLEEIRQTKNKRDVSGKKIINDSEKNYKNALVEVDKMHMKAVIELKAILNKTDKMEKYLN